MTFGTGVDELYCLALRMLHYVHTMTTSPIDTFSEYFPIGFVGLVTENIVEKCSQLPLTYHLGGKCLCLTLSVVSFV